jgi:hypothetical protein
MLPVWAIPLIVKVASKVIDLAFDQTEKQPQEKKDQVYDKIMKQDRKAYGKMRGTQHVK